MYKYMLRNSICYIMLYILLCYAKQYNIFISFLLITNNHV